MEKKCKKKKSQANVAALKEFDIFIQEFYQHFSNVALSRSEKWKNKIY